MTHRRPYRPRLASVSNFLTSTRKTATQVLALVSAFLVTLTCLGQEQQQTGEQADPQQTQEEAKNTAIVAVPAGSRIALVLTQPIQSRHIRHGDDIYAQITSPVNSGNEVVIPPGTFVRGKVDKLERKGGRGELRLQSMSMTLPDGYVVPVSAQSRWRPLTAMRGKIPDRAGWLAHLRYRLRARDWAH